MSSGFGPFSSISYDTTANERMIKTMKSIKNSMYWITMMLGFIALFFIILIIAVVFTAAIIWAHRSTLSDIENKADDILDQFKIFINGTTTAKRDFDKAYVRAKNAHERKAKALLNGQTEIENEDYNNNEGYLENEETDESYISSFMHVLLQVFPIHDEGIMINKFTRYMEAWDSMNDMVIQANKTGIVGNTSRFENNVNNIIENTHTQKMYNETADTITDALIHREDLVHEYNEMKRRLSMVLYKTDLLLNTPAVKKVLNDNKIIQGMGHLGVNLGEMTDSFIEFGHSHEAKKIGEDVVDIIGATNQYHIAKYMAMALKLAADIGSKTAGLDLEAEMNIDTKNIVTAPIQAVTKTVYNKKRQYTRMKK